MKDLREGPLVAVNLGLEMFADALRRQNVPVTHVNWRPPAGGNRRLAGILEKLEELDR